MNGSTIGKDIRSLCTDTCVMTSAASQEHHRSDEYIVAHLNADAVSVARTALSSAHRTDEYYLKHATDVSDLCDLFHNVAVWMVVPESLYGGATSPLDAVLRGARNPWVRQWIAENLVQSGRHDLVAKMDSYHHREGDR